MTLLFEGRGGGSDGRLLSASWPFVKFQIFDDKITHRILFVETEIPFDAVHYINRMSIPFIADGFTLHLDGKDLPPNVSFFGFKGINKAEALLREKCRNLGTKPEWHRDPYQVAALLGVLWILLALSLIVFG